MNFTPATGCINLSTWANMPAQLVTIRPFTGVHEYSIFRYLTSKITEYTYHRQYNIIHTLYDSEFI